MSALRRIILVLNCIWDTVYVCEDSWLLIICKMRLFVGCFFKGQRSYLYTLLPDECLVIYKIC